MSNVLNFLYLPGNVLWKHPVMVYNKDPLSSPLTTLPTDILQAEAVKLFKVNKHKNQENKFHLNI